MTVEEIGKKMDALDLWKTVVPSRWAVKPRGCAFPYFCTTIMGDIPMVKVRFVLLDGWQTLHDYMRLYNDIDFGYYAKPIEMPHFELLIRTDGEMKLFRCDTGYAPRDANERERELCAKILWESYGILLRIEADRKLPLMFAEDGAMFARVEQADGTWQDAPLVIPPARPLVEQVSFSKKALAAAKDLPIVKDEVIEVDMTLVPGLVTQEPRPRVIYLLAGVDAKTGKIVFRDTRAFVPEGGLRQLWESMAPRILEHFIERRAIPGEVRVSSGRAFRMIRPLCIDLPFKLSKVEALSHFTEAFKNLI